MSEIRIKLPKSEGLLVQIAHNDAELGHRNIEQVMQSRLSTITESHSIKDGTTVSFKKEDDGEIYLVYDDGITPLKLYDENGVAAAEGTP